jgi:SAM-dependent methyltransferase
VIPFGADYAGAYDALYRDKDYVAECDLLEGVFRRYGDGEVKRVLDLGCGTGGHSHILADRGYDVVGVDRSADMLQQARQRHSAARFLRANLVNLDMGETFDAAVIMFAVLGYLTCNAHVISALKATRKHLRMDGMLFADVWYGPAVLAQRPGERVKVIDVPNDGKVIRSAASKLDTRRNVCTVHYQLWRLESQRLVAEVREQHAMRYFFEPELEALLSAAEFELLHIGGFPDLDVEPSEQTWNVAFVARAR